MNLKSFLDKYGTETSNIFQLLQWAKQLKIKNFHVLMRDEKRNGFLSYDRF